MPGHGQGEIRFRQGDRPRRAVVGLTFLLPGVPQWLWSQRERGLVLFGSFAASLSAGLFAWGTRTGLVLLAFAYLTHVASSSDAIRQWAFPGFGRWVPVVSTSAGLAIGCYGPAILFGSLVAWPGLGGGDSRDGYLVNRLAYQGREPDRGESVWLGPDRGAEGGTVAEVVARPGEEVEWSDTRLRVQGRDVELSPFRPGRAPSCLVFKVPDDQFLIAFRNADPLRPKPWELVPRSRLEGQAWAKLYPVWERRLLQ